MTPILSFKRDAPPYIKRRIQPKEDRMNNDLGQRTQLDAKISDFSSTDQALEILKYRYKPWGKHCSFENQDC